MSQKIIRLRVVVQRNGLPDNKFMLPVSLEEDPTIAKLLEQIHSTYFPLESDQWGLEDYAVHRQAPDGSKFECLHFSTVQSIFRDDDQAIIRPLQTDDVRRRRLSGRYQISADGRHLVDGVPFGRPLLRVPANRPPVYIPPRKKRRLVLGPEEPADQDEDMEEDTPRLLLTNGQSSSGPHIGSSSTQEGGNEEGGEYDDDDEHEDDGDFDADVDEHQSTNSEEEDSPSEDDSESELDEEDLAEELQGLRQENAALGEREDEGEQESVTPPQEKQGLNLGALDKISALQAAFPSAPLDICEKILTASGGELKQAYTTLSDGFPPELSDTATLAQLESGPAKPSPRKRRKTAANATALTLAQNKLQSGKTAADLPEHDEEDEDEAGAETVSDFVRQFDHRGLPPGSISSGKGLSHMAIMSGSFTSNKVNGDSEATSATLGRSHGSKSSPDKTVEEDDETSSSGTSSSSEEEDSEAKDDDDDDSDGSDSSDEGSKDGLDFDSESDSSHADDSDADDGDAPRDSSSNAGRDIFGSSDDSNDDSENDNEKESESDSDSESESESDSGPEEATMKGDVLKKSQMRSEKGRGVRLHKATTREDSSNSSSSEDTSDEDSSEAESSSDDSSSDADSDEDLQAKTATPMASKKTPTLPPIASGQSAAAIQTSTPTTVTPQPTPVPPGQGKESTKSRNARRRAALRAKKQAQAQGQAETTPATIQHAEDTPNPTSSVVDESIADAKALFEAKRKELLDALASGGVEVDAKGDMVSEKNSTSKRKRDVEETPAALGQTPQETPVSEPGTAESDASQKRRRLDVGAGRRLLFGALGLRNPKGKEDEENTRAKLMEGVRPLTNHRMEQEKPKPTQPDTSIAQPEEDEDPEAWRNLITYRAVECCQEGVELSEPPFPFVQRWDPQQQSAWHQKNADKRGGRGKRAERNQAHFYQEEQTSRKKRKHDESFDYGGDGYDETFNGIEDDSRDNIQLNYDDVVEPDQEMTDTAGEMSQFTDIDDLPSLPSDLSTLPVLRPGEVKPGMVITWKKWSCSVATNWQPMISDVTGVVVRIDDEATGVEVCLAKRDRDLDGNPKRYDPVTGQRIYNKFEAPDLEEEEEEDGAEEEDAGYRTLSFAEMQEPRILQQPFSLAEGDKSADAPSPNHPVENEIAQESAASKESVPAQPEVESHGTEAAEPGVGDANPAPRLASAAPTVEPVREEEDRTASHSTDHQPGQGDPNPTDLSVSMSDMSGVSSPSRQLHETASQAAHSTPIDPGAVTSSGYKGDIDTDVIDPTALLVSDPVEPQDQSSAPAFGVDDDELLTGTPKVKRAKVTAPSSVSSVRSGRQLDYTMDEDEEGPNSLRVTEADDEVHGVSTILGADGSSQHEDQQEEEADVTTPTPSPTKVFSSDQVTPLKAAEQSARESSTPQSLASINAIFSTARTSRQTQSPLKSQSQSQVEKPLGKPIAKKTNDLEYEAAMRKLDEQSAEEQDEESNIPDSFRPIVNQEDSQISIDAPIKDEPLSLPKVRRQPTSTETKISPPPPKRTARKPLQDRQKESSSQFTLPPGTQVIELLSSSDAEPEPEEDYADDDVDDNYSPKIKTSSSLPHGTGWVNKKSARSATAPLHARQFGSRFGVGKGLSSSQQQTTSQSESQSRWSTSNSPPSSLPANFGRKGAGGKKGRKTSAKF